MLITIFQDSACFCDLDGLPFFRTFRNAHGAGEVILQAVISVAVDMLPLPGGVGSQRVVYDDV